MTKAAVVRPTVPRWVVDASVGSGRRRGVAGLAGVALVAEVTVPLVVGLGVSRVMTDGRVDAVTLLLVGGVIVLAGLLSGVRTWVLARITAEEMRAVRTGISELVVSAPAAWVEKKGVDDVVSLFSTYADQVEPLLTAERIRRLGAVCTVAACLVMMTVTEWRLIAILLVVLAIGFVVILIAIRGLKTQAERALLATTATAAELGDYLRSVRSAKVYALESRHLSRLGVHLGEVEAVERHVGRAQAIVDIAVRVMSLVALLGVTAAGAVLVAGGHSSVAHLSVFLTALAIMLTPLAQYSDLAQRYRKALGALPRLDEVPGPPKVVHHTISEPSREVRTPRVDLSGVVLAPATGIELGQVDLRAGVGDMVCLVGPSGSGKSTVLAAIAGFLDPTRGTVRVYGRDLSSWDRAALRRQLAYVEQGVPFVGTTVRDFLTVEGASATDDELLTLLSEVGLSGRLGAEGLDSPVDRAGTNLSGGERQRLSIVRAFASGRPILLMDEPTGHLDRESEQSVLALLEHFRRDRVVVVATHSEPLLARATCAVFLGELSSHNPGPPAEGDFFGSALHARVR